MTSRRDGQGQALQAINYSRHSNANHTLRPPLAAARHRAQLQDAAGTDVYRVRKAWRAEKGAECTAAALAAQGARAHVPAFLLDSPHTAT
jgi:hypothetical protein